MTDVAVSPPDQTAWWDVAETAASALSQLRLESTDVDATLIEEQVPVAGWEINQFQDRTGPPIAGDLPTLQWAIVRVTMAMYRAKASPPSDPDLSLSLGYVPADPLAEVRPMLARLRNRMGVA